MKTKQLRTCHHCGWVESKHLSSMDKCENCMTRMDVAFRNVAVVLVRCGGVGTAPAQIVGSKKEMV